MVGQGAGAGRSQGGLISSSLGMNVAGRQQKFQAGVQDIKISGIFPSTPPPTVLALSFVSPFPLGISLWRSAIRALKTQRPVCLSSQIGAEARNLGSSSHSSGRRGLQFRKKADYSPRKNKGVSMQAIGDGGGTQRAVGRGFPCPGMDGSLQTRVTQATPAQASAPTALQSPGSGDPAEGLTLC